ncbi:MAG: hypothetical protein ACK54Y_09240, partial [Bacteroidota bacterium]
MPSLISLGDTWNVKPLHTTVLIGVTSGFGFTYTVNVNDVFSPQLKLVGRIVYTAVCIVFTPLCRLPEIYVNKLPVPPPVSDTFDTTGPL